MAHGRRGRPRRGRGGGGGGGGGKGQAQQQQPEPQPFASAPETDRTWLASYASSGAEAALQVMCGWSGSCGHGKKRPGPCHRVCCFEGLMLGATAAPPPPSAPPALRAEGAAAGLVNLGSTCYLNALLQTLFAVPELRSVLWARAADASGPRLLHELARLFARLAEGLHASVRPEELVRVLNVSPAVQQDAQELLALLIAFLREQCGPGLKGQVDELFVGRTAYVTRCGKCGRESQTQSEWSQLQLPVQGTLEEAMASLLAPEALEGANQYVCDVCKGRVDASRTAVLQLLPPVLIVQCMRFLYDVKSKGKRKITTPLTFPRCLDLSAFSPPPNGGKTLYQLEAAVLHIGASAYGGHYVAHVKAGDAWLRLDDATAGVLPPGSEGEEPPSARPLSERLTSSTAYLLFYRSVTRPAAPPAPVPPSLRVALEAANQELVRVNVEHGELMARESKALAERTALVEALLGELKKTSKAGIDGRWISVDVLSSLLAALQYGTPLPPLACLQCPHALADPTRLPQLRFLPEAVYVRLVALSNSNNKQQGGAPPSPAAVAASAALPAHLCEVCAEAHMKRRLALAEQARHRDRLLAENASAPAAQRPYVVSKSALGDWRKTWPYDEVAALNAGQRLVKDLQCEHGRVCSDGRKRETIGAELWALLDSIYAFGTALKADASHCLECEAKAKAKKKDEERLRNERSNLRKQFSLLLSPPDAPPSPGLYWLVSGAWLEQWRLWLNADEEAPEIEPSIDNRKLLCAHSSLILPPLEAVASGVAALVPEALWAALRERFPQAPAGGLPQLLITATDTDVSPAACTLGCVAEARAAAEAERLDFTDAELVVQPYEAPAPAAAAANNGGGGGGKEGATPPSGGSGGGGSNAGTRRSPRKRRGGKKPEEVRVRASASDTVAELKLKIFEQNDLPPATQRLRFGTTILDDNTLPLRVYAVPTGAVLTVEKVEDGEGDADDWVVAMDGARSKGAETAFENTSLLQSDTDESMEDRQAWECAACTFSNEPHASHCQVCDSKRSE